MSILEAHAIRKAFRIPHTPRTTIRQHAVALFRRRTFKELLVLDDISFDVRRGESLGIMGRNGCGKSTLLKILAGIYEPDAGSVARRAAITPILELGVGWNPELDAIDNVYLIGAVMGLTLSEIRAGMDPILDFAGVTPFANLKLQHYSTGMASRLAYAVAFQAVREVLILDEVFAVGDAGFRLRCEERYRALRAAGHTMILVSHNPDLISVFCDRGLLLEGGQLALESSASHVASAYMTLVGGTGGGGL